MKKWFFVNLAAVVSGFLMALAALALAGAWAEAAEKSATLAVIGTFAFIVSVGILLLLPKDVQAMKVSFGFSLIISAAWLAITFLN